VRSEFLLVQKSNGYAQLTCLEFSEVHLEVMGDLAQTASRGFGLMIESLLSDISKFLLY
jgi:hypothetical protein